MGHITILNKHHLKCEPVDAIYIGRGSPLGNPYPVNEYGRDNCIEMYKGWLDEQIKQANQAVLKELNRIGNLVMDGKEAKLLCFCKPKNCHGDHIANVVRKQIEHFKETQLALAEGQGRDTPKECQLIYAGIGSRATPPDVLSIMASIAEQLAPRWTLRSGWADGADQAFFAGANEKDGQIENYLPWPGFNHASLKDPRFIVPDMNERLMGLAESYHPWWHQLKDGAKKLHARNGCQILGRDLETPVKMVICWTVDGKGGGGTGQALRIARDHHIPIFDLALPNTPANLCRFVENMESE